MKRFNKIIAMALVFVILFTSQAVTNYASAVSDETVTQEETVEMQDKAEVVEEELAAIEETTKVPEETIVAGDAATEVTEQQEAVEEEATTGVAEETTEVVEETETELLQEVPDFDIQYVYVESNELVTPGTQNILISADTDITSLEEVYLTVSKGGQLESTILVNKAIENLLLFTKEYSTSETGNYKVLNITYKINGESYTYNIEEDVTFSVTNENTPVVGISGISSITDSDIENSVISTETNITPGDVKSAITNSEEIIKDTETSDQGVNISKKLNGFKAVNVSKAVNTGEVSISQNIRTLRTSTAGGNVVIVLDPGHGGSDSGTTYGSLQEKNLNLAIARYAKAELEKYPGVTVYLTRNSDTYVGLYDRANYAKNVGATALVSIHINSTSGGATTANGAEVFVTAYSKFNATSTELARLILSELAKVGLSTSRGVKINNDDHNNGQYDDGTWKDDLAVIRQSILNGIPAILVEHGFINNSGDYSLLANESKLKEMGVADANAIAQHYGLKQNLPQPTASSLKVSNVNGDDGTFDVTLSGINAPAGINKVQFPIWSKSDQSDLFWYTATKQSDGSYIARVDIANHNYNYGTYNIHAYVLDGYNRNVVVQITSYILKQPAIKPISITATGNSNQTTYTLNATGVSSGTGVKNVKFAVWSMTGGQDDLVWYGGTKNSSGVWTSTANISNHQTGGTYQVHAYADYANGASKLIGTTTFKVTGPTATGISVTAINKNTGTFRVVVKGANAPSGIKTIQIPVWSNSNQSDIHWYAATRQSDGTYVANGSIYYHGLKYGNYTVHAYAVDNNGVRNFIGSIGVSMTLPATKITASGNGSQTSYALTASNLPYGTALARVRFAVWSNVGGQDDLIWYTGTRDSSGNWTSAANISNHKTAGTYYVHVYADLVNGTSQIIGTSSFKVTGPTATGISVTSINQNNGTFKIVVKGASSPSGINSIQIPVWSNSNQSDIHWYAATRQSDGTYVANGSIYYHGLKYGNYTVHAYAVDNNGIRNFIGATGASISLPSTKIAASGNSNQTSYALTANNLPYGTALTRVRFAVWSNTGGQDDLVWYTGTKNSSGNWISAADISKHRTEGTYYVHAYGDLVNGASQILGTTSFTVTGPSVSKVSISEKNETNGYFEVQASGVSSGSGIQQVKVAVWCATNQSDIVWYTATKTADGAYTAYIDIRNHNNNLGNYKAHVYVIDNNGINKFGGATTAEILNVSNTKYLIMGSSAVTVNQMVNYYNANATYPSYYATSDAPTIADFCQIYLEEATAEGIKVEVAFTQAMKETNFLRYTGTVGIAQYNFAGIGATGNGVVGNSFLSVRLGIRAQIQHLKAYASTDGLNNPCVDPRFKYVARGTAIYVEWLGIKENPYGKGWATAVNYGYSIINDYISRLIKH